MRQDRDDQRSADRRLIIVRNQDFQRILPPCRVPAWAARDDLSWQIDQRLFLVRVLVDGDHDLPPAWRVGGAPLRALLDIQQPCVSIALQQQFAALPDAGQIRHGWHAGYGCLADEDVADVAPDHHIHTLNGEDTQRPIGEARERTGLYRASALGDERGQWGTPQSTTLSYAAPLSAGEGYHLSSVALNGTPRVSYSYERFAFNGLQHYRVNGIVWPSATGTGNVAQSLSYGPAFADPAGQALWGFTKRIVHDNPTSGSQALQRGASAQDVTAGGGNSSYCPHNLPVRTRYAAASC